MSHFHAAIWIDHHEARVISFSPDESDEKTVAAHSVKHSQHSAASHVAGARRKIRPITKTWQKSWKALARF